MTRRIPACIADVVGDTVGDIAGMEVALLGSFARDHVARHRFSLHFLMRWRILGKHRDFPCSSLSGIAVGISSLVLRTVFSRVLDEYGTVEKTLKLYSHHLQWRQTLSAAVEVLFPPCLQPSGIHVTRVP